MRWVVGTVRARRRVTARPTESMAVPTTTKMTPSGPSKNARYCAETVQNSTSTNSGATKPTQEARRSWVPAVRTRSWRAISALVWPRRTSRVRKTVSVPSLTAWAKLEQHLV